MTDVIVIGGGVNGLVAAAALAGRKLSVVLFEQQPVVGGAAITAEFHPGFLAPTLSHALGPVHRDIIRALRLDRAGLEFLTPDPALTTVTPDGRAISFHRDPVLTAASISPCSAADAGRWREFTRCLHRIGGLVGRIGRHAPPSLDEVGAGDWWRLLAAGRHARGLGRRDLQRLARWVPMSVADLTSEWFETDAVKAAIAAHAIFGNPAGPRSGGTGGMLLQTLGADAMPVGSGTTVAGGPGALSAAIAKVATDRGARIVAGARVVRILTERGRAVGALLDNGDQLSAGAVVAAVPPKHALLDLLEPTALPPSFTSRVRHTRSRGVTAKINLALANAPSFPAFGGDPVPLRGRILIAPDLDYLERAFDATKYGEMSRDPWLELAIPSMRDRSLAPEGQHVLSIYAHFAPRQLRSGTWEEARDRLYRSVLGVLEAHAPGVERLILAREIVTPEDLERRWGVSGGHIFHGEPALDQSWIARPLLGWARYRTPIDGLYLASAGTHPGGGLTGLPGWLASKQVAGRR